MIGYEEFASVELSGTAEAREQFFLDNDVCADDLLKMGREVVGLRLSGIPEGATLTALDIELAMLSMLLLGYELGWKLRDQEAIDDYKADAGL